jgi:predicted nucleotidyltransferase
VEHNRHAVERLCVKHRVKRLELFGSAAAGTFNSASSDLDFLVEFQPLGPGEHADAYFGLLADLEDLFRRPVDLVMPRAIRNRYFLEGINRSREVLYAADAIEDAIVWDIVQRDVLVLRQQVGELLAEPETGV